MKPSNRSMPQAVVIPVLSYPDVREAVAWLCRAFGFVERLQIGTHRAQLAFGAGSVVVTEGAPVGDAGAEGGRSEGREPARHSIMVRVDDVDAHFAQATAAGAVVLGAPQDHVYGERQYTVRDPGGHVWTFSQTVADVDPASWGGVVHE